MNKITRVITARIVDEYGGVFNEALVVIWKVSGTTGLDLESEGEDTEYNVNHEIDGLAYRVNYYYSAEHKAQGFKSRPLKVDEGSGFTGVLSANLDDTQVKRILSGPGDEVDKVLNVIEYDIDNRF